jgi:hypothetical protein
MINEQEAFDKLANVISFGLTHPYYDECIEISDYAFKVNSAEAEDQKEIIEKYRKHETKAEKKQRIRITNPITSVPLGMVYAYFEETYRTDGIKKKVEHPNDRIKDLIDQNFKQFYQGESLHEYLHETLLFLNRFDPNGWIIFESNLIENNMGEREALKVYPVVASCKEAIDFSINENGRTEYLIVRFERSEMIIKGQQSHSDVFDDFYLYGVGFNWHFAETKSGAEHKKDYEAEGYELIQLNDQLFYIRSFNTGTKEVPAIRAGAYLSGYHKNQICETPVESAKPILNDLMGEKSLFDTQKVVHIFPEKMEYVKKCHYEHPDYGFCENGYYGGHYGQDVYRCGACNGTGKLTVSSEQQNKTFAWPDSVEDLIDLSKITHYVERPINIIEFYEARIDKLIGLVKLVSFNQETIEGALLTAKTATEVNIQDDRINNKIAPFAKRTAKAWELAHRVAFQMYGLDNPEANMTHPHDYKLKSTSELIKEFEQAKAAGQPYEVLWSITTDILNKQHRNNPEMVNDIQAFQAWKPWKDKRPEEVFFIIQNRSNEDFDRLLWENWDRVVRAIKTNLGDNYFYLQSIQQQGELIRQEVEAIRQQISFQGFGSDLINETIEIGQ